MPDNSDDDPQALRERVDELEQQVEALAEDQGGVTRREALLGLSGIGMFGGGLALGSSESAPAQTAQAQAAASGQVGTPDNRVDVYGATADHEVVNADEVNNVHWLDPDADDFGAAVMAKQEEMGKNDVLRIPPVEYTNDTTALIEKNIAIIGDAGEGIGGHYHQPLIRKTTDVPIFETADIDYSMRFSGMRLDGLGMDENDEPVGDTPLIVAHDRVAIDWCGFNQNAGHAIHLAESGVNHNFSKIVDCGAKDLGGDFVHISEDSFGIEIDLRAAMTVNWAVNINNADANGITARVHTVVDCLSGGVKLGGVGNAAKIDHFRSTDIGIQFESSPHVGEIGHYDGGLSGVDPFVDNSDNPKDNTKIRPDARGYSLPDLDVRGAAIPLTPEDWGDATHEFDDNLTVTDLEEYTILDTTNPVYVIRCDIYGLSHDLVKLYDDNGNDYRLSEQNQRTGRTRGDAVDDEFAVTSLGTPTDGVTEISFRARGDGTMGYEVVYLEP